MMTKTWIVIIFIKICFKLTNFLVNEIRREDSNLLFNSQVKPNLSDSQEGNASAEEDSSDDDLNWANK